MLTFHLVLNHVNSFRFLKYRRHYSSPKQWQIKGSPFESLVDQLNEQSGVDKSKYDLYYDTCTTKLNFNLDVNGDVPETLLVLLAKFDGTNLVLFYNFIDLEVAAFLVNMTKIENVANQLEPGYITGASTCVWTLPFHILGETLSFDFSKDPFDLYIYTPSGLVTAQDSISFAGLPICAVVAIIVSCVLISALVFALFLYLYHNLYRINAGPNDEMKSKILY
uniref:Uncharacterized protein n=1 Tax=Tetranychus urticae TaxID=32264 RepID=T1KHV8_TETUR